MNNMLLGIMSALGVSKKIVSWVLSVAAIWIRYIFIQISIDLYLVV
jgi:hypothetical protein